MKVGIYGSGNLAWHLTRWFSQKQISLVGISGRNAARCREIWPEYLTPPDLAEKADIIFLAIPDNTIAEAAEKFKDCNCIVVHCSGATGMEVFAQNKRYGVVWPVQTFTRNMFIQYHHIHLFIEGSDEATGRALWKLASTMSDSVHVSDSEERGRVHLSAVFVSNYLNHLLFIGDQLAGKKGPGIMALQPLIEETVNKAFTLGTLDAQTGPARRRDTETMNKHLKMLEKNPAWKEIYGNIADSIMKTYEKL
jgi:predicted short-subunit dehydrogenase-like oxidoreductase (DUF2520 family)